MIRNNLLKWILLGIIGVFLSGCAATVPVMEDKFDAQAESFKPPRGKANIYVVREDTFVGSAVLLQVLLNGRVQGAVAPGTYLLFSVSPGSHSVAVITQENAESVTIQARSGKNYFIDVEPVMGWAAARTSVKQISPKEGHEFVIKGKRAKPLM